MGRIVTRIFRVWEKKRGHRHTGSRLVGSAGEALFFGLLFVLGSVCLASVITSQVVESEPDSVLEGEHLTVTAAVSHRGAGPGGATSHI